jgi:hypothetical protein
LLNIADILSMPLANLIGRMREYRVASAYLRGLNKSGTEDINVRDALKMHESSLNIWLRRLPGVGAVAHAEIMGLIKDIGELPAERLVGFIEGISSTDIRNQLLLDPIQRALDIEHYRQGEGPKKHQYIRKTKKRFHGEPSNNDLGSSNSFYEFCIRGLGSFGAAMAGRYNLELNQMRTLEEVGNMMGLTRERVRQIEARCTKTLNDDTKNLALLVYESEREQILGALFGFKLRLQERELYQAFKALPLAQIFLVNIFFGGVKEWARAELTEVNGAYISNSENSNLIQQKVSALQKAAATIKLPCPISVFANVSGITEEDICSGLRGLDEINQINGYLLHDGLYGSRTRRAVNSHELMSKLVHAGTFLTPIDLCDYLVEYKKHFPEDDCRPRDLDIVFIRYPHLFIKMYEYGWVTINPPEIKISLEAAYKSLDISSSSAILPDEDGASEDLSIKGFLEGFLTNQILRFDDLRKRFVEAHGDVFSKSSVGPILIGNLDMFSRYAPSLYGLKLKKSDSNYLETGKALLLDESQCEMYCLSAHSGSGIGEYILWDVDMEYRWAKWLSQKSNRRLLSSLLFVAEPNNWNCPDWERVRWIDEKKKLQHFGLEERNRFSILENEIDINQLVSTAIASVARGYSGWTLVNRTIGARLDDRHSQSYLALLILIGLIRPAKDWQSMHELTEDAAQICHLLINSYSKYMLTSEPEDLEKFLISRSLNVDFFGWVNKDEILNLFSKLLFKISPETHIGTRNLGDKSEESMTFEEMLDRQILAQDIGNIAKEIGE